MPADPGTCDGSGRPENGTSGLTTELAWRDSLIAELRAENAAQSARIAELERRLGLDSSSSGRPPPGDGLAKPTAEELRERQRSRRRKSGRQPGEQRGHACGTLARREVPDRVEDHHPAACVACGGAPVPAGTPGAARPRAVGQPLDAIPVVTDRPVPGRHGPGRRAQPRRDLSGRHPPGPDTMARARRCWLVETPTWRHLRPGARVIRDGTEYIVYLRLCGYMLISQSFREMEKTARPRSSARGSKD